VKQTLTAEVLNGCPLERLVIKGGGKTRFLDVTELECIEALECSVSVNRCDRFLRSRVSATAHSQPAAIEFVLGTA
jgi:hypothetical protein